MEVRVFDYDGVVVAGLTATMDSTNKASNSASNCVDGNENTMCHNNADSGGWLEIDMGESINVSTFCA